jgi:hypothetical protein
VQSDQLIGAFAGEVLLPYRELNDQVIDRSELVERSVCHVCLHFDSSSAQLRPYASVMPKAVLTVGLFKSRFGIAGGL